MDYVTADVTNVSESTEELFNVSMTSWPVSEASPVLLIEYDIVFVMETYIAPAVFLVGLVSNLLCFLVFSTPEFRHSLTSLLYRLLAVLDSLLLLTYDGMHTIPRLFDVSLITYSQTSCKVFFFLFFSVKSLSAWVLVVIGLERVIGVLIPHKAKIFNTRRRFVAILLSITAFVLICFSPLWATVSRLEVVAGLEVTYMCYYGMFTNTFFTVYTEMFSFMELTLTCAAPSLLILIFNTVIVLSLLRRRRQMLGASDGQAGAGSRSGANAVFAMMFAVSLAFLLFSLPYGFYFTLTRYRLSDDPSDSYWASMVLLGAFVNLCDALNHSINGLLYCIAGKRFRQRLALLLSCSPTQPDQPRPQTTYTTNAGNHNSTVTKY